MNASAPIITNATTDTFERDVVQQSMQRPVVVDFWAPWCGPCQQLGPILEKVANEYAGKFALVKIDVDQNPEIAAQVQSIPLVLAFVNGQPVDQFAGALPEESIREWIQRFLPSPADELVQQGEALEGSDPKAAEAKYREAADLAPDDDSIRIRIARVLVAERRFEEAESIIQQLEKRGFLEPEAQHVKSQLDLQESAEEAGGIEEARRAAEENPDDLSLQIRLADALAVGGKHREALETCLSVVERDKTGAGVDAKRTMLEIFDVLGDASELTSEFRRKLATVLY